MLLISISLKLDTTKGANLHKRKDSDKYLSYRGIRTPWRDKYLSLTIASDWSLLYLLRRAFGFVPESGREQIINKATHRSGNCLDLVFTDFPSVITSTVGPPLGTSGHAIVSLVIKIEQAVHDVSYSRKVYIKSQADWNVILSNLPFLNWSQLYKEADPVTLLNEILFIITDRRTPSRALK